MKLSQGIDMPEIRNIRVKLGAKNKSLYILV